MYFMGFFVVRPARAHSCGCKSCRKLITTNEVKRNCERVGPRKRWRFAWQAMPVVGGEMLTG